MLKKTMVLISFFFFLTSILSAEQNENEFRITSSGVVQCDGHKFLSIYDYVNSDYFKQAGKRCMVKTVPAQYTTKVIERRSDCSLYNTVIRDEYWPAGTWVIPVVVHNITDTDNNGYLDDDQIQAQIDVLNEDYGAILGTLGELGFDSRIRFELAEINRVVNNSWFNDEDELEYKTYLNRDPDRFLNVYTNTASGYLGYSYMPQDAAGTVYDGVVVLYETVGGRDNGFSPYDQGRTLIHEVGHYLGMLHTFEGYDCYTGYDQGDLLQDTYPQNSENYECVDPESCDSPDNIHNYMNYTDDLCMHEFTAEQANRMVCSLLSYRPGLAYEGNNPPLITSLPDTVARVNEWYQYTVEATDAEDDPIEFSLQEGPEGMELDPQSGELTWLPGNDDAGLYQITIFASDQDDHDTQSFNLSVLPEGLSIVADFDADTTIGNAPFTVQFNDLSLGEIIEWFWDFGDTTTSDLANPEHSFQYPGEYTVKLRVTGSAGMDSLVKENYIHVLPFKPVAGFEAEPIDGYRPTNVRFTDLSTGEITDWFWDFGDSSFSILQNPVHVYTKPGLYTISLAVQGPGGADTLTVQDFIHIKDIPVTARFDAVPKIGKSPLTVQFADSSTGNITAWYWDFGDGSTSYEQNPQHTFENIGSYTVVLIAIGQSEFDTLKIEDYIVVTQDPPVANFFAGPLTGPWPLTVQFTDSSTGLADNWHWDFGDSTLSRSHNPLHTYEFPGVYTVSQIVTGPGGADTLARVDYINVLEKAPLAWFGAQETTGIIPFTVHFSDSSSGIITSWFWDFGDSTTSEEQHPIHEYANPGDYTISLTVTGPGGSHTVIRELFVNARHPLAIKENETVPTEFKLHQNYPNPFNASTTISYQLPDNQEVWLGIFDMNGKLVRVLEHGNHSAGSYQLLWAGLDNNGMPVSSGVYMVQLHAGPYQEHIKVLLLK